MEKDKDTVDSITLDKHAIHNYCLSLSQKTLGKGVAMDRGCQTSFRAVFTRYMGKLHGP